MPGRLTAPQRWLFVLNPGTLPISKVPLQFCVVSENTLSTGHMLLHAVDQAVE